MTRREFKKRMKAENLKMESYDIELDHYYNELCHYLLQDCLLTLQHGHLGNRVQVLLRYLGLRQ